MKETRILMGMPITVEITDVNIGPEIVEEVFSYFDYIDKKFSTYKDDSELSRVNRGEIAVADYSKDMKSVLQLSEETKTITHGYFDIQSQDGSYDPSGLVKGWAIYNAAQMLTNYGCKNFYVEAGGDIQAYGENSQGQQWRVGICNPFNQAEIVKTVFLDNRGMATSGTYIRGQHIYNPRNREQKLFDIVSMTVIGPTVYEADRLATAAFAMGRAGIQFIENFPGLEGYMIDTNGVATMTSGFNQYIFLT